MTHRQSQAVVHFEKFPPQAKQRAMQCRELIRDVAREHSIRDLQECLKWGEPAFVCQTGSTIRIDWKPIKPDQLGVYFNCKSRLVETFREIYVDIFQFDGNRAIILPLDQPFSEHELKQCFLVALTYHQRKKQPMLGL